VPWMVLHMLDNYQDLFDPLTWSGNDAVSVLIYCQHPAPLCIVLDELGRAVQYIFTAV
jgi:hypothetical protein